MAADPFCNGPECLFIDLAFQFEQPIPRAGQVGLFNVDENSLGLSKKDKRNLDRLIEQHPVETG